MKIGQDFQRHGVFQIAAVLIVADFDLRLHRRLEFLVIQRLGDAFLKRLLQHLAQHGFSQPHLQDRKRRLAPAETGNLQVLADFGQLAGDLAVDIRRGDGYPVFALQAFGRRFRHLHVSAIPIFRAGRHRRPDSSFPFDPDGRMVRAEGLEPPRLSSLAPKASASTNSATPARPARAACPRDLVSTGTGRGAPPARGEAIRPPPPPFKLCRGIKTLRRNGPVTRQAALQPAISTS